MNTYEAKKCLENRFRLNSLQTLIIKTPYGETEYEKMFARTPGKSDRLRGVSTKLLYVENQNG